MKLTVAEIRAAKATKTDRWLNDGGGLYLRIGPGGSKTWVVRRKRGGKTEKATLGAYPALAPEEAGTDAVRDLLASDDVAHVRLTGEGRSTIVKVDPYLLARK